MGIETVYQDLSLIPNLSVVENIGLTEQLVAQAGRLNRILDRQRLLSTAKAALAVVGLPSNERFVHHGRGTTDGTTATGGNCSSHRH